MSKLSLPDADSFALFIVITLALIVLWDAFWLTKQTRDVPKLGELENGVFAWASEGPQEVIRQWGNLFSKNKPAIKYFRKKILRSSK